MHDCKVFVEAYQSEAYKRSTGKLWWYCTCIYVGANASESAVNIHVVNWPTGNGCVTSVCTLNYWVVQSLLRRFVLVSCNIKMLEEYLGMRLGLCTIAWASAWCVGVITIDYVNVGITCLNPVKLKQFTKCSCSRISVASLFVHIMWQCMYMLCGWIK